jgi:hypothetical protein
MPSAQTESFLVVTVNSQTLAMLSGKGEELSRLTLPDSEIAEGAPTALSFDPWGDRVLVSVASDEAEGTWMHSIEILRNPTRFGEITFLASSDGRARALAIADGVLIFEEAMGARLRFLPRNGETPHSAACPGASSVEVLDQGTTLFGLARDRSAEQWVEIRAFVEGGRLQCVSTSAATDADAAVALVDARFEVRAGTLTGVFAGGTAVLANASSVYDVLRVGESQALVLVEPLGLVRVDLTAKTAESILPLEGSVERDGSLPLGALSRHGDRVYVTAQSNVTAVTLNESALRVVASTDRVVAPLVTIW